MTQVFSGALKGTTVPNIIGNVIPGLDPETYGGPTLQDFEPEYWMPASQELTEAVLFSGVSALLVMPPTIDEAIGFQISIFDNEPDPVNIDDWMWYSEVSVEFLGTESAYMGVDAEGSRNSFFYPDEELFSSEIPPGKYRARGYSYTKGWREYAGFGHPDSVGIRAYPTSGRQWETLPTQLRLDLWPEDTPRPRKDVLEKW